MSDYSLKQLSDEATEGEWVLFDTARVLEISPAANPGESPGIVGWSGFDSTDLTHGENRSNALFIVELVNAYRAGKLVEQRPEEATKLPDKIKAMKIDEALVRLGQVAYERDLLLERLDMNGQR